MADKQVRERGGQRFWRLDVTVWAHQEQVNRLSSDIQRLLCPDPDHAPPCPIPWEIDAHELEDFDRGVESLRHQVAAEGSG